MGVHPGPVEEQCVPPGALMDEPGLLVHVPGPRIEGVDLQGHTVQGRSAALTGSDV